MRKDVRGTPVIVIPLLIRIRNGVDSNGVSGDSMKESIKIEFYCQFQ